MIQELWGAFIEFKIFNGLRFRTYPGVDRGSTGRPRQGRFSERLLIGRPDDDHESNEAIAQTRKRSLTTGLYSGSEKRAWLSRRAGGVGSHGTTQAAYEPALMP
jgi:hypothetical protein